MDAAWLIRGRAWFGVGRAVKAVRGSNPWESARDPRKNREKASRSSALSLQWRLPLRAIRPVMYLPYVLSAPSKLIPFLNAQSHDLVKGFGSEHDQLKQEPLRPVNV